MCLIHYGTFCLGKLSLFFPSVLKKKNFYLLKAKKGKNKPLGMFFKFRFTRYFILYNQE